MVTDAADLQSIVCTACQARQTSTMMPSRQQVLAGCSWLPPPPVPMRPDLLLPQPVAAAAAAKTDVGQGPHDVVRTATSPQKRARIQAADPLCVDESDGCYISVLQDRCLLPMEGVAIAGKGCQASEC